MKKYYNIGKNILFPICRSLTGKGVVKTLKIIQKEFPSLLIKKIRSGSNVFDWKVPFEWNVVDAYILDKKKNKIVNFKTNNLHLVGYSVPVKKSLEKKELFKYLYFLKKQLRQYHTLHLIMREDGVFVFLIIISRKLKNNIH